LFSDLDGMNVVKYILKKHNGNWLINDTTFLASTDFALYAVKEHVYGDKNPGKYVYIQDDDEDTPLKDLIKQGHRRVQVYYLPPSADMTSTIVWYEVDIFNGEVTSMF